MDIIETFIWNILYWILYAPLTILLAPEANTTILIAVGTFCSTILTAHITRLPGIIMSRRTATQQEPVPEPLPEEPVEAPVKKNRARKHKENQQIMEVDPYANQENPTTQNRGGMCIA